jgi:uncharacterized protein
MAMLFGTVISRLKNYKLKTMLATFLIRKLFLLMSIVISVFFQGNNETPAKEKKVLIFSKTNGFRHESIPAGIEAIKKLGADNHFSVDATEDSTFLSDANLGQYNEIIFLSTTGTVLGTEQEQALQNFIHKGGGFVGIHAASDCEYQWPWYVKLIGGNFESHPKPQQAKLMVVNKKHPSTKHLPDVWERTDEWYNFKNLNPDVTVLIKIDETSYTGGKNGDNHPMAWYHEYDGGKVFYTELGHTKEAFSEPLYLQHLLGGIKYAMGKK